MVLFTNHVIHAELIWLIELSNTNVKQLEALYVGRVVLNQGATR